MSTIKQLTNDQLAEYMGNASSVDGLRMREELETLSCEEMEPKEIPDDVWNKCLETVEVKRSMDKCTETFDSLSKQPDCGIIDLENALFHQKTCKYYKELCEKVGESPDSCTSYCRVLNRISVMLQ